MGLILLKVAALVAGVAVIGIILLMDRPEDLGKVSDGWKRKHRSEPGNRTP